MNKEKIAIFGANSKSAQHLVRQLKFEGFEVILFSSSSTNSQMRKYDIYDSNHVEFDFKIAIYFSWAIKRTEKDQHIAAQAAALFGAQAKKKKVYVIFISSLASLPIHSKSNYGNYKLEAEHSMKMSGHAVVRPGTITSKHDADISSSLTQMLRYVTLARIFTYLSRKILIPTVGIECFSHEILNLVKNPQPCDINLIQNIVSLEEFSSITTPRIRLPLSWVLISRFRIRSNALDRLTTLISVSTWIRENQDQLESMILE
jgi:hypothetical protein